MALIATVCRARSPAPVTATAVPITASSVNVKTAQTQLAEVHAEVSVNLSSKMERLRTGNQGAHAEYSKAQLAFAKDEQGFATARQKAMAAYENSLKTIVQGLDAANATYTKAASKWKEHLQTLNSSRTVLQQEHDAALSSAASKLHSGRLVGKDGRSRGSLFWACKSDESRGPIVSVDI